MFMIPICFPLLRSLLNTYFWYRRISHIHFPSFRSINNPLRPISDLYQACERSDGLNGRKETGQCLEDGGRMQRNRTTPMRSLRLCHLIGAVCNVVKVSSHVSSWNAKAGSWTRGN